MALKNLFDMVKADRYTQDGREAIIKAQEAETEDATRRTYQIGEISQATGLQKTANGWVKPKSGKQPGAASKHDTDPQTYIVKKNDELRKMYLNEKDPAKKEAMKKALKKQASMMEPEPFSSTENKPDESARIAASKEARAKKSQELGQKAAGDFAKYKDLPPVQRKDALGAASHEGISIGLTQRSMEGMGWDLIQADDKVNVYGKPDGSKATMKHDGKKITEVSYEGPGSKPAAQKKSQSVKSLKEYLTNNFWSQPEDFKNEMADAGWDVDEMTNEYAVISNEAGSQYEVRFADHGDGRDLTMKSFKALYIDEDDDDSLEDSAPSLSEIVDRVYNIGEISEKTGLMKTANGWVKPPRNKEIQNAGKHAETVKAAQKAKKEEARKLQRAEGEANARAFQEKVDKGEINPAAPVKRNEAEKVKHSDGTESYRIKGTQFYFNTPEEAENAILAKNRGGTTYARPSQDTTVNNIQESLGFKLDTSYGGKHSMDDFMKKIGENEYAANVWSFGTDSKGTLINPLSETDKPNATIKKENGEWKLHYKDRDGKETVVTANGRQDPTRDSAPRVLTGDCRIRIRKEKPALTGDTKIRVRK